MPKIAHRPVVQTEWYMIILLKSPCRELYPIDLRLGRFRSSSDPNNHLSRLVSMSSVKFEEPRYGFCLCWSGRLHRQEPSRAPLSQHTQVLSFADCHPSVYKLLSKRHLEVASGGHRAWLMHSSYRFAFHLVSRGIRQEITISEFNTDSFTIFARNRQTRLRQLSG